MFRQFPSLFACKNHPYQVTDILFTNLTLFENEKVLLEDHSRLKQMMKCLMPYPKARPNVCCNLEYFVASNKLVYAFSHGARADLRWEAVAHHATNSQRIDPSDAEDTLLPSRERRPARLQHCPLHRQPPGQPLPKTVPQYYHEVPRWWWVETFNLNGLDTYSLLFLEKRLVINSFYKMVCLKQRTDWKDL